MKPSNCSSRSLWISTKGWNHSPALLEKVSNKAHQGCFSGIWELSDSRVTIQLNQELRKLLGIPIKG